MAAETLARARVRTAPAALARVDEGAGHARRPILGRTVGRLPARLGVLRLRRRCSTVIATRVSAGGRRRGAAPPRRPRHLRAVALGDRQLAAGGLLGGVSLSRRADRRRGAHRRSLRQAQSLSSLSPSSSRRSSSAPGMRRIRRSRPSRGPSSSSSRRSASGCSTSTSACSLASSCTLPSTSSGSRCRSFSPTRPASGSRS